MTYVVCIKPGTKRCSNFFNFLSAEENRLSREWPDNFGLSEALKAGIDPEDYGWYIDDIQNATITREPSDKAGKFQYNIEMEKISPETPAVIEAISCTTNIQGHAHINTAYYITENGDRIPVSESHAPTPYEVN